jgi:hypothetical protein
MSALFRLVFGKGGEPLGAVELTVGADAKLEFGAGQGSEGDAEGAGFF